MNSFSIGGHKYTDPDVLALIFSKSVPLDPRIEVLRKAREALQTMDSFGNVPTDPFERLQLLASICGIANIVPLSFEQCAGEPRDAFISRSLNGDVNVFFNPLRPFARQVFSIAHEIAHTFIQNSTSGAIFRHSCAQASREANELERLCDLAASELLMPETAFQAAAKKLGFNLVSVPQLMAYFGCSYEATTFRLASAFPAKAAAGLLRYRLRLEEERRLRKTFQQKLFDGDDSATVPQARYRRQAFHASATMPSDHFVRWNKSFVDSSVVYALRPEHDILSAYEVLPNGRKTQGLLQVTRAPFQRPEAHPVFSDLLFLWTAN